MVCTDAAARGIDIPLITHVVQSSFAFSAIDFLHRVRTPCSFALMPVDNVVKASRRLFTLLLPLHGIPRCMSA